MAGFAATVTRSLRVRPMSDRNQRAGREAEPDSAVGATASQGPAALPRQLEERVFSHRHRHSSLASHGRCSPDCDRNAPRSARPGSLAHDSRRPVRHLLPPRRNRLDRLGRFGKRGRGKDAPPARTDQSPSPAADATDRDAGESRSLSSDTSPTPAPSASPRGGEVLPGVRPGERAGFGVLQPVRETLTAAVVTGSIRTPRLREIGCRRQGRWGRAKRRPRTRAEMDRSERPTGSPSNGAGPCFP